MQQVKIQLADNGVIKTVIDDNINGGGESYESTTVYEFDTNSNKIAFLGDSAGAPIWESASNLSTNAGPNDWYMEDGSYLRIQNVSINYDFDRSLVEKIGFKDLRVSLQANILQHSRSILDRILQLVVLTLVLVLMWVITLIHQATCYR